MRRLLGPETYLSRTIDAITRGLRLVTLALGMVMVALAAHHQNFQHAALVAAVIAVGWLWTRPSGDR